MNQAGAALNRFPATNNLKNYCFMVQYFNLQSVRDMAALGYRFKVKGRKYTRQIEPGGTFYGHEYINFVTEYPNGMRPATNMRIEDAQDYLNKAPGLEFVY